MAHSLSAKKRIRQSVKRRARNRAARKCSRIRSRGLPCLAGTDIAKAKEEFRKTTQRLDKVAAKRTIHKNTAARKRSRLAKRLNVYIAAGGAPKAHVKGTKAAKA